MEQVKIQVSPKQMSKLRNGYKVRIKKPSMAGNGVSLMVNPSNYSNISKSFTKNKGSEIILSPQEILANREQASMMEGGGIFGKKFDTKVEEVLGQSKKKKVYQYAKDVLNPLAKAGITAGLVAGSTALGTANPALIPYLASAVPVASYMAYDYLDNPSSYQSNAGGPRSKQAKTIAGKYVEQEALNQLNSQLGTNMGNLSRAGLEQAVQDKVSQQLTKSAIQAQQQLLYNLNAGIENINTLSPEEKQLLKGTQFEYMIGRGLYASCSTDPKRNWAGKGLYAGKGLHSGEGLYAGFRRGGAIIGNNGGFVKQQPQALQSQSQSDNFQFRYTLPVARFLK